MPRKKILVISTNDLPDPRPDDGWDVEQIECPEEAPRTLAEGEWSAVVADVRSWPAAIERLTAAGSARVPIVAIVGRGGGAEGIVMAKRRGIVCIDEQWLAAHDGAVLRVCLRQMIEVGRQSRQLKTLQERQRKMLHAEKFAAVGLLAAEIAHEINNPSTFVITNLTVMMDYVRTIGAFHDALRERLATDGQVDAETFEALETEHEIGFLDEDLDALLDRSLAGLNRIYQIVQDLRYFSRDRTTEWGWVDVDGLVRASAKLVRHEARYRCQIVIDLDHLPAVESDANRLSQVILNVLVNAVQAIPAGEPSENEVRVWAETDGGHLRLRISDTGPGIESEHLEQIFEPFFTTKEPGVGTGLGLSIASDTMKSLGGRVTAESEPGEGSVFTIHVPLRGDPTGETRRALD